MWYFAEADSCDMLLKHVLWEATWCVERVYIGLNWQQIHANIASCITLPDLVSLLIFTSLRERKHGRELLALQITWLLLMTCGIQQLVEEFNRGLLFSSGSCCGCCWFIFGILKLLNWTARILILLTGLPISWQIQKWEK